MGPMYIATPCMYTNIEWAEMIGQSHGSHVYCDTIFASKIFVLDSNHHHVMQSARISLTLSRHPSQYSSLPAGPQGYTSYPHKASVCRCKLVALPLLGHVKGSIGLHHLRAYPYFSSSVLHVWLV